MNIVLQRGHQAIAVPSNAFIFEFQQRKSIRHREIHFQQDHDCVERSEMQMRFHVGVQRCGEGGWTCPRLYNRRPGTVAGTPPLQPHLVAQQQQQQPLAKEKLLRRPQVEVQDPSSKSPIMLSVKVLVVAAVAFLSTGECGRVKRQDLIPSPRLGKRGSSSSSSALTLPYREAPDAQGLRILPLLLPIPAAEGSPMSIDASRVPEESEAVEQLRGRPVSSSSSSPAASSLFLRRLAHRLLQEPLVAAAAAEYPRMADASEMVAAGYGQ
ncbi:uncharacterized protein LOC143027970 [Oratosquilla oratoria]|uniref:uncharacterized protein LOC143027970 n=1 Tax=Oratosquilla oratoria TaxID=337810 RepID=UPI003F768A71